MDAHWLLSPWGWLSLAAITAGLEILLPGAFMIWLSAASLATAVVALFLPDGSAVQLAVFALFTLVALFASRQWKKRHPIASDDPALNRMGLRLVGERVIVAEPIVGGRGKVHLRDGVWLAEGPDAPEGAVVQVEAVDGAILRVGAPQAGS